ncbi:RHD3/Sey1 [Chytriomyces cf. hyalinus JEL632]|nr:RHD3/Sey1 [Chytriomyces cf. hyalinus JEL632]
MSDWEVPSATSPTATTSPDAVPDTSALSLRFSQFDETDQRLQIINDQKQYSPIVSEYMKRHWGLSESGFGYNVVAVFGSQSTGKSTLLNRLFGTNFDVMNESTGRQQTTKGIWVSKADGSNTLVLDVEGTDGGERFEDQDFERKSALFALAIAEVVIVNIYENNVGLYNGANLGLLKTVLDVNLQLFQRAGSPKTCLHFVIRDFTSQTPLTKLADTLTGYLSKIWSTLSKPAGKENCSIDEFFTFAFTGLPHKIFARDSFESAVTLLRHKFSNPSDPEYAFQPILHKRVPADGFASFANGVWDRISSSKDLDLPTQTQLLAEHRCEEIAKEVFDTLFVNGVKALKGIEAGKVVEDFGNIVNGIVDSCLEKFDVAGSRYQEQVYQRKRSEFRKKMSTNLLTLYTQQLTNISKRSLETFTSSLAAGIAADTESGNSQFAKHLAEALAKSEAMFREGASAAKLQDAEDWSPEVQHAHFISEVERVAGVKRKEEVEKMMTSVEKLVVGGMKDAVIGKLNEGGSSMWVGILNSFGEAVDFGVLQVQKRGQGFESTGDEIDGYKATIRWQTWTGLLETLNKETTDDLMLGRMKAIFEARFRYDENGVPRLWSLDDPIDTFFQVATDDADKSLNIYAKMDVPLKMIGDYIIEDQRFDPACVVIITSQRLQVIRDRFKKDAGNMFVEAKRSMVITTAKIPPWFIGLTIMLGWNEFMLVLFNPIYFTSLAILLGGLYVMWQYGMIGPALKVASAATKEVVGQVKGELAKNGIALPDFMDFDKGDEGEGARRKESRKKTTRKQSQREEDDGEEIEMKSRE